MENITPGANFLSVTHVKLNQFYYKFVDTLFTILHSSTCWCYGNWPLSTVTKSNVLIIQSVFHSQSAVSVVVHQPQPLSHRGVMSIASGKWFVMKIKGARKNILFMYFYILDILPQLSDSHIQRNKQIRLKWLCPQWRWALWLLFLFTRHNTTKVHWIFSRDISATSQYKMPIKFHYSPCSVFTSSLIGSYWQQGSKHHEQECQWPACS